MKRKKRMKAWTGWCLVHKKSGVPKDGLVEDSLDGIKGDIEFLSEYEAEAHRIARVIVREPAPRKRRSSK